MNALTEKKTERPGRIDLPLVRWTAKENQFLTDHYQTMELSALVRCLPGRTGNAIKQQAGVLGLWGVKQVSKSVEWTEEELAVIRDYYPDNGIYICCDFLPGRTRDAIALKIKRSGLSKRNSIKPNRISPAEWSFVLENVARLGFVACAEAIADTPDNLRDKCSRRNIDCRAIDLKFNGGPFQEGSFDQNEIDFISARFSSQGGIRVGLALNREPTKVINFAKKRLGLRFESAPAQPLYSLYRPVTYA